METDNERWTMFQRRQDGSVDFYPNWTDCSKGFNNLIENLGWDLVKYIV